MQCRDKGLLATSRKKVTLCKMEEKTSLKSTLQSLQHVESDEVQNWYKV